MSAPVDRHRATEERSTGAPPSPALHAADLATWRRWLKAHHGTARVVWLVFHKGPKSERSISYDDALDEALCWGWIDSIVRRIDGERFARKFTPRANPSKWSAANIERLRTLLGAKRVQPAGRAAVSDEVWRQALTAGRRQRPAKPALAVPAELERALAASPGARIFFASLAPSYRRNYVAWVSAAKQSETRQRRAREAVRLLAAGQKVLLK